jgi:cytosine/adenosine deaminase-related metal-dependent hydrolase
MLFSAKYVLPIDRAPLEPGWVETAGGRIVAVGQGRAPAGAEPLGDVALLPGLVNAHTHLELSWLAGRLRPAASMVDWIRALLAARAAGPPGGDAAAARAAREAARTLARTGCVLVGDVSNTLTSWPFFREAGLAAVVFHELLGFNVEDAASTVRDAWRRVDRALAGALPAGRGEGAGQTRAAHSEAAHDEPPWPSLAIGLAAHAPYSTSPALMRTIAETARGVPLTLHLAESADELEFLRTGGGAFRALLEELGVWDPAWEVPQCDPVEYLDEVGYLKPGLLAVHAVHLSDDALEGLREAGGIVVTCPRSNEWVGGGLPRVTHFYAEGIPVAIGTDSLASSPTLNLFDELAELRRIAPDVSAASLLESATRIGAKALGLGAEFGTITAGKRAAFAAVAIPPGTADVEEYLVGGVPSGAVRPVLA